jgi:uncharacterized protein YfiM (DUF2279 family)
MSRPSCTLAVLSLLVPWSPIARADLPSTMLDTDADATWSGETSYDYAGRTIAGNCDVNGDGYPDLLVGAYGSDDGGASATGEAYLLLGGPTRWSGDDGLYHADASWVGTAAGEYAGMELGLVPDMDGDGYDEIAIGAYPNDEVASDAGKIYLIYGEAAASWGTDVSVATAEASWLGEAASDRVGRAVAGLGDVNGDGLGDMLVGGCWNSSVAYKAGEAYLIMGDATRASPDTSMADASASFTGEADSDYAGRAVGALGDVDGDGYADMAVGAYCRDTIDAAGTTLSNAGKAYVIMGRSSGWAVDQPLEGFADAGFVGEGDGDYAGLVLGGAGDVDGDGYADMIVASYKSDLAAGDAGAVYLVLGQASGWSGEASLSMADAVWTGEDALDYAGRSATGVGDVDQDGFDDLLIGATGADDAGSNTGRVYLVLGSAAPAGGSLSGADTIIDGTEDNAELPYVLAWAGDLDGGGHPDLVLPGYMHAGAGTDAGRLHVVYTDGYFDQDGDGFDISDGDCDDGDASVYPGAGETPYDGIDQDCDGSDLTDVDGDGHDSDGVGGDDCDDGDAAVSPSARELCFNGIDDDCDGSTDVRDDDGDGENDCDTTCPDTGMDPDQDGDGVYREECGGEDCDDEDPQVHPNASEIPYDGVDQDCDGADLTDVDEDGFDAGEAGGDDCDDENAAVHPGAEEIPYNGLDDDCSEGDLTDVDGDGHDAEAAGGEDCDDENAAVHPDAEEICDDGIDNDCDDVTDADDADCGNTGDTESPCGDDTGDSSAPADTGAPEDKDEGCSGCASGGGLGALWLLVALPLVRRRHG